MKTITTRRLVLRSWRDTLADPKARADLETRLALILTRPVLEHLPEPLQPGSGETVFNCWVSERAAESDVRLVEDRATGDLLGLLILAEFPGQDDRAEIRIGYLLAETAWGKGFATELLEGYVASLAGGPPVLLVGGVGRGNPASVRVLEKAGFERDPTQSSHGTDVFTRKVN